MKRALLALLVVCVISQVRSDGDGRATSTTGRGNSGTSTGDRQPASTTTGKDQEDGKNPFGDSPISLVPNPSKGDDDQQGSGKNETDTRKYEMHQDEQGGIRFTGEHDNRGLHIGEIEHEVRKTYHTYNIETSHQFSLALQSILGSNSSANISMLSFALKAVDVFEYNEVNGVIGYQSPDDVVTGRYNLSAVPSSDWTLDVQTANITDEFNNTFSIFRVTVETVDQVFSAIVTFAETSIQIGDTKLSPESMKIDFVIRWFTDAHVEASWTTGPSNATAYPNASVAVSFGLGSSGRHSYRADHNPALNSTNPSMQFNGSESVNGSRVDGFFAWEPRATMENKTRNCSVQAYFDDQPPVNFTRHFDSQFEIVRAIYFSFPGARPAEVTWDPEFGSSSVTDTNSTTTEASSTSAQASTSSNSASENFGAILYPSITLIVALCYALL